MAFPDQTDPLHKLPQALRSGFASRLRLDQTSLFVSTIPIIRSTKRSAAAISYAEIDEDYDDDDDNQSGRGSIPGTPFGANSSMSLSLGPATPATPANGTYYASTVPSADKPETKSFVNPTHVAKVRHMLRYNDVQLHEIADLDEVLVPIRLNLEYDNFRISDFFLWNLNEKVLTPEMFAITLCQDLDLPIGGGPGGLSTVGGHLVSETSSLPSVLPQAISHSNYVNQIASTINTQIHEYTTFANVKLPEETGFHVIINLSVNLNKQLYEDKFEWDLSNGTSSSSYIEGKPAVSAAAASKTEESTETPSDSLAGSRSSSTATPLSSRNTRLSQRNKARNSVTFGDVVGGTVTGSLNGSGNSEEPEAIEDEEEVGADQEDVAENADGYRATGFTPLEFARTIVQDTGLSGEFYPAIAHAIYESLYRIKKDALDGHLPPQEVENYAAFGLEAGWRVEQEMLGEEWAPSVETLSQEEIEKREIERERNIRRLKRESARMGGNSNFDGFGDGAGNTSGDFGRGKRRRRGESPAWH